MGNVENYSGESIRRINQEYMPPLDLEIARYISYDKLEGMLSAQSLYFCNASNFLDKYEGEIPLDFFDGWARSSEANFRLFNGLKTEAFVPYVSCWTPYVSGNTKMWNEYAGNDGVCIITTVRHLFMLSRLNGGRIYRVHYLDENEQMGNTRIPFYTPSEEERTRFGLPAVERVFHAIKKYKFKDENEIRSIIYKNVRQNGLSIPFEFSTNVSRIVLNPHSTSAQKEAVIELANRHSYTNIVEE